MGNNCPEMNLMDSSITSVCWPVIEDAPTPYTHRGAYLPENLRQSLDRYAKYGVPTGGFLRAVLENDLHMALARADASSLNALPAIAAYIYNCLPSTCWGNAEKVKAHIGEWFPRSEEFFRINRPADYVVLTASITKNDLSPQELERDICPDQHVQI